MRILVTGAAGFAAEHLIPLLREKGHYVIGCDRLSAPSAVVDEFFQFDLIDINNLNFTIPTFEIVIHLAAARADWGIPDSEFYRDNHTCTVELLNYCKLFKIGSFLFASTIAVYAQDKDIAVDEDETPMPFNAYGKSKLNAEMELLAHAHSDAEFCLRIVRPSVLYGPSNPKNTGLYRAIDNNIFRLIDGIYRRRFAFIGSQKTPKSTAYVKNFAAALDFLIPPSPGAKTYIYCDEPPFVTGDLVRAIRRKFGRKGLGPSLPYGLAKTLAAVFDWIGPKVNINFPITKARIETFNRATAFRRAALNHEDFEQPFSSEEALDESVEWYMTIQKDVGWNAFFFKK